MDQEQEIDLGTEEMGRERGSFWWLLMFPVVGCLIGWFVMLMAVYVLPAKYESVALVQINGSAPAIDPFGAPEAQAGADAGDRDVFFRTETRVLTVEQTLLRVVERLDLASRWNMSPQHVTAILEDAVEAEPVEGTDLVEIRVRHTNAQDARDIAEKVAESYQGRRIGMESERAHKALDALHGEVRDQSDLVEEKRKVLDAIMQALKIPDMEGTVPGPAGMGPWSSYVEAERDLAVLEQEKAQLEIECQTILTLKSDEIMTSAPFLDAIPRELYARHREYLIEKGVMEEMVRVGMEEGGLGGGGMDWVRQRALVEVLKNEMESGVAAFREAMQTRLNMLGTRVEQAHSAVAARRDQAVNLSLESQDFVEAKREYESAQALLQAMTKQHDRQRIRLKIPGNPVTIHEQPHEGRVPVSPDVDLYLTTGKLGGAAIGGALALLVAGMRRGRDRENGDDGGWADD